MRADRSKRCGSPERIGVPLQDALGLCFPGLCEWSPEAFDRLVLLAQHLRCLAQGEVKLSQKRRLELEFSVISFVISIEEAEGVKSRAG